ncbi:MAG: hydantoinase/oxoprolinase family protein, partial [Burkholderiales bacterium]|nr:hydantoinase/oxoprolinase family protein [Burkholderiales bacterium]
ARPRERHRVWFEESGDYVDTPVYERAVLAPGCTIAGPAIVEQSDTTTIIHPGQRVDVDRYGNLLVHTGAGDAR